MGSNPTFSVADWPGFNVTGKAVPDTENPVPKIVAPLIITGTVPVEVKVTDCDAAAVFTKMLPKAILVALTLIVGNTASSCKLKVSDTPLAAAVNVTA